MTFLAPAALFGTLLLSIPIVVHLFKPRKMRQTPFSSLRWLKLSQQRLSRRIQWHQWLLFLVRAGCILLFVLALARPMVGTQTDRFVIVDAGGSMSYRAENQPSTWARAEHLTAALLQKAGAGDHTALIVTGKPPRLVVPPVANARPHLDSLTATGPGQADATLSAVLPLVRSLLLQQGQRDTEVVFLGDNLENHWRQEDIRAFQKELPVPVRIQVVDLGPRLAQNSWIAGARLFKFGPNEDGWIRVEIGHAGEAKQTRTVRLTGIAGLAEDTQEVVVNPGRLARVDFRIPAGTEVHGQVADIRLEPADALPGDDRFLLNLDVPWALRVLLVEPEAADASGRSVGLHLRTAAGVLSGSKRQAIELATRTGEAVAPADLQQADVILLAGVAELSDAVVASLEERVRAGAGLAIFLGPHLKPAFYNQKLRRSLQPEEGLMPLTLKTGPGLLLAEGNPGRLTNMRWTHPLLAPLHDVLAADQSQFRIFATFADTPGKNDTVLARFDDEAPALIERAVGAGRVILLNTSANDAWSDWPRRQNSSFVPLVDRLLSYLSGGGWQRSFTVGDAVVLPLPGSPQAEGVSVLSPGGLKLQPRLIKQRGLTLLRLDDVGEAGVYHVEGADKKLSFVVNTSRADSALVPMDRKILEQWWAPTEVEFLSAEDLSQRLARPSSQWPMWPSLIVLASLLLIVEAFYVSFLCPRANPKVAGMLAKSGA